MKACLVSVILKGADCKIGISVIEVVEGDPAPTIERKNQARPVRPWCTTTSELITTCFPSITDKRSLHPSPALAIAYM